ncbi:3-hydroxyisobutyrate dehydrogenase [Halteromyces radiatus]|uniref:3-hydroxyisobutyrate dehydrogenase n=1 Tax=Halteromyces radiatus TaxID=101107 RepID=UPI0022205D3D|nr:3-hydroxyisobutyrate dehydrogenase [Halteromyces radiatus]KAI8086129.1 3-hydroxyisobutyrate dehydrogenase [Halteromyces radiatus]
MAKNLAEKSTGKVVVYDMNVAAVQSIVNKYPHVEAARTAEEVAEKASTVMTMLPASMHVEQVYKGLETVVGKDHMLIDSSTIEAQVAQDVAERMMAKQALAFDAPVSGGTVGADKGTLTFMVGAPSQEAFEKTRPILSLMGKNVVYCGKNGTGQVAKLCNNMLLGISMVGVAETMLLGAKLGMDPLLLASIINNSTGRCWSSDSNNPYPGAVPGTPSGRGYQGGFSNKLMAKDLGLAMKAAESAQAHPTLGTMAAQIYAQLSNTKDFETLDFSSVYKWLAEQENNNNDDSYNKSAAGK